ncbi:HDOD domain-containing protein [Sapientia aquatica]|uniref:HDOD domain-containing protein n=1 Tax=Sapientia aquatica TaxID=1549640 RepID=A0A4R5VYG1_9BURK|nr:HDOD domain-containing protein [Sapientia aquatica]TDK63512.1 HDOD domain-containing protein [Sapientia aquatica]
MTRGNKNTEFEFIEGLTADLSSPVLIFPTSLNATMNIRRAISQENISNDSLARIVGTEPVLSAQVLKLSNSAAFNTTGKPTTDLRTATMRLGFAKVRNLTITVGMKQLSEHQSKGEISQLMEGLWNRSLRVASSSYVLAKHISKLNPDSAMLAGLLHDVGKFYILNRASYYQSLFTSQKALWNVVDAWHSSIGAAILENWDIPEDIRSAVQNFGNPDYNHTGVADLTDLIVAADLLDAHFDERSKQTINWEELPSSLARLSLNLEKSEQLIAYTKEELNMILQAIS